MQSGANETKMNYDIFAARPPDPGQERGGGGEARDFSCLSQPLL